MSQLHILPSFDPEIIRQEPLFFLFETSLADTENFRSYLFTRPVETILVKDAEHVESAFKRIEEYSENFYIAGYFAYELGPYFEDSLCPKPGRNRRPQSDLPGKTPLICAGVFDRVIEFDHRTARWSTPEVSRYLLSPEKTNNRTDCIITFEIGDLLPNITQPAYRKNVRKILDHIAEGNTYQVNFTYKYKFSFTGCPFSLYEELKSTQYVPYSAFLKFGENSVLSLSPELFFRRDGDTLVSKPMKGTMNRGKTNLEDRIKIEMLKNSPKDLAENTMIVDLMRNDIGRIAQWNTLTVPALHSVEKYLTVLQMTSTVSARLRKDITYYDIFKSMFPCGSVTGAPKIRTMQIIREMEKEPRNVYCGAIGIISPGKKAVFNVPIRTVMLSGDKGEMGIGSGIVADSDPEKELKECLLKSNFLVNRFPSFKLLETLLWDSEYVFLKEHVDRIRDSAFYFDYHVEQETLTVDLKKLANRFHWGECYKIRILLERSGALHFEHTRLETKSPEQSKEKKIAVSEFRTDKDNVFLYHKTDNRVLYNEEYLKYSKQGYYEVVFRNFQDEITEGAISNIFIYKNGAYFTPPAGSGILEGIYRASFMKTHKVKEKILYENDLHEADALYMCNSVMGMFEVSLS